MRRYAACTVFLLSFCMASSASGAAAAKSCIDCHAAVQAGQVVHAALGMGCESCHAAPHKTKKPELSLVFPPPDLCFNCHDRGMFDKKFQHTPVTGGMCTSCHAVHSSQQKKLLSAAVPDLCFSCHDKGMFSKKNVHPPVAAGDCSTCHSPHGSDAQFNLTSPLPDLCVMCHDQMGSGRHIMAGHGLGNHPVAGKPDPSRAGRELSCTSCHNPHSSSLARLFTNEAQASRNICLLCHKKIMVQ